MSEAISIDALLRLQMKQAEKDLEKFAKTVKPIDFKVNFKVNSFGQEIIKITEKGISSSLLNSLSKAGDELKEKIEKAFDKANKIKVGSGILRGLGNLVLSPLQGIFRGAFEGIGRETTQKLGQGITRGIEQELSKSLGSFDFIGEQISSRLTKELLIEIKPLVDVVENSIKDIFGDRAFKVAQGAILEQQGKRREIEELQAIKGFQRERDRLGQETGIKSGADFNQALSRLKDKEAELKKVANSIRQKIDTETDASGGKEIKEEIDRISNQIDSIAKKLEAPNKIVSDKKQELFGIIAQLQETTDTKVQQQLEKRVADLQELINSSQKAVEDILKQDGLENLMEQRTALYNRLQKLTQRSIDRNQKEIEAFEGENRELLAEFSKLNEIGKILNTLREFGTNVRFDDLLDRLKIATSDVAAIKTNLARLKAANTTDRQKIEAFINAKSAEENEELIAKIDEAIAAKFKAIEERSQQIEALNANIEESVKQVNSLATQAIAPGVRDRVVSEIDSEIRQLENNQNSLQQEFNALKDNNDEISKQRKVLLIRAFNENKESLIALKQLNKRLILAGAVAVSGNFGTGSNEIIAASSKIEEGVKKTERELNKIVQQVYQSVLNQVAAISGVAVDPALIPRLKVAELPQGARGSFESATNTITVSPKAVQSLAAGAIDPQFATTLVHELRHAIQSKFGQIPTEQTDIDLLKATKEELSILAASIEASIKGASGVDPQDIDKLRAIEEDAYTFANRYTAEIVDNINQMIFGVEKKIEPVIEENLTNIVRSIEKEAAKLLQIDLPNLPDIDPKTFLVVENARELESILQKEFSAKGLTQIVKRLGLGVAKNKATAIERVVNAYRTDNFKTLEIIARMGDEARLKSSSIGVNSNFGLLESESQIKQAFKNNQQVLRKLFQLLDDLQGEDARELSEFIKVTAKEQIDLIDRISRDFKTTGKTAQSLSGSRSQFTALYDFETIKSSLATIESTIDLISQIEPKAAIEQISKIEPELKSYIKSIKSLDKTNDVEAVRQRLEQNFKTLTTAKNLALEAVEVSAIELVQQPVKAITTLKDSAIAKAKQGTKNAIDRASDRIKDAVVSTVENIVDDVKGNLITALQTASRTALPEVQGKALPPTGQLSAQTADTVKNILIRAAADVASLVKSGHSNLQAAEKVLLELNPLLKAAKLGLQVSAPVAATGAVAAVSPEFAAIANSMTGEVAQVLLPLVRHFTLFGFGAEKLAEAAAYLTVFGTAGQAGIKTIQGTAKKVGQAAFDATPQAFQDRLTPENIKAFDAIVADKQKQIKALVGGFNEIISDLKQPLTPQNSQKLLTGYQQVSEEISNLERLIAGSDDVVLKVTRDRLKELRAIRDKLAKAVNVTANKIRDKFINLFDVDIQPLQQTDKDSLKIALANYQKEIETFKQRIESKILTGQFVDSDLQAAKELARRSQALARTFANQPGFKRQGKKIQSTANDLLATAEANLKQDSIGVGDDVINGILQATTQRLQDVGRSMGKDLLLGFKKELGIQSPSKKMMEQMEYVIAGIAQSQTEKEQLLKKIGKNLAIFIEDGFDELTLEDKIEVQDLIRREKYDLGARPTKAYLDAQNKDLDEIKQGLDYWERIENQHIMEREDRKAEAIARSRKMRFGLEEPSFAFIAESKSKQIVNQSDRQLDSFADSSINTARKASSKLSDVKKNLKHQVAELQKATEDAGNRARRAKRQLNSGLNYSATEILAGVEKGVVGSLPEIEKQGEKIGDRILKGFRDRLGIASPSKKFIEEAKWIVRGIIIAAEISYAKLKKTGAKLGDEILSGFEQSTQNRKVNKAFEQVNREVEKVEKEAAKPRNNISFFDRFTANAKEKIASAKRLGEQFKANLIVGLSQKTGSQIFQDIIAQTDILSSKIKANLAIANKAFDEGNRAADRTARNLNRQIDRVGDRAETIFDRIKRIIRSENNSGNNLFTRLQSQLDKVGLTAERVKRGIKGLLVLGVGSFLIGGFDDAIRDFSRSTFELTTRFEQLETQVNFATGGIKEGAIAFQFAQKEAQRLKVDIEESIKGYASLAAATKNNDSLRDETDRIFQVINQASRVTGSTAQQNESAFLAVRQMIDNSILSIEELKQLAESGNVKGVFKIAERSLGLAEGELRKLVSTGTVAVNDFLPKFIDELDRVTRSGVNAALQTTASKLQAVKNEFKQLQVEIGKNSQSAQKFALDAIALGLEKVRKNLHIIIPVLQTTAALAAVAILPTALQLGKFLGGLALKGLTQVISLLGITNTQLMATNAQLILLANTSPKMALLIGTMQKLSVAMQLVSAAAKAFIIIQVITRAIELTSNLVTINQEAKNAIEDLDKAYQDFLNNLSKNNPDNLLLKEDIIAANQQKVRDELGKTAKFLDSMRKPFREALDDTTFGLTSFLPKTKTFAEAAIEDAESKAIEAIALANANLSNITIDLGTDVEEIETEDLKEAVNAIERSISNLDAVDPQSLNTFDSRTKSRDRQKEQLEEYNQELVRRGGLTKSLARVEIERRKTVDDAVNAEREGLNALNQEILESGDFKRDIELEKLNLAKSRIDAELEAEKQAIAENEKLIKQRNLDKIAQETEKLQSQLNSGAISARDFALGIDEINQKYQGFDPDTGFLKGLSEKEIEAATSRRDRLAELQSNSIDNAIALANEEVETKLRIYDDYLEEIESRRQQAEDKAIAFEKQRLIDIQQLVNDEVISTEYAEDLKEDLTRDRITSELEQEKQKLRKLKRFKSNEVEVQEKADEDIKTSKTKILDLTLQLLEREKQAEEKAIAHFTQARDNYYSKIESNLNRLQQIQQTEAGLVSDRNSSLEKLGDLELAKLRQALELRKQLNTGDLNADKRRTTLRQLYSLGIDGKTTELGLLEQIEDKEKAIADEKLRNLLIQQEFAREQLRIENELLRISTTNNLNDAKKKQIEAERQVNSAEQNLINASPEERSQADKLLTLAEKSLKLANDEVDITQLQVDRLDGIIDRKERNLQLSQDIAAAELKSASQEAGFDLEKEFNAERESRDRRRQAEGKNVDIERYLSRQEKINEQVEGAKEKGGEDFTEEDEAKLRAKLNRQFNKEEGRQEGGVRRGLQGNSGFTVEGSSQILELIKSGKPFLIPEVPKVKSTAPLQTETLGKTKGSVPESQQMLKVLEDIRKQNSNGKTYNIQMDNQFINQYQQNNEDEILRKLRSEQADLITTIDDYINNDL